MTKNTMLIINLVGEQPAPNLLPVYELHPQQVILVATDRTKSVAKRLSQILIKRGYQIEIVLGHAYDVENTVVQIQKHLPQESRLLVGNFTGGTKLMVLALLRVIQNSSHEKKQLCYFQTEKSQGILYFYDPDTFSLLGSRPLHQTLTLEDYLTAYLGEYRFEGPGTGPGRAFEETVANALKTVVDELEMGLKKGGALDIDLVFRCGNQVGIAEVKTGKKARTKEGIDQLNTAGGREFLGIYVKKFLIVDTSWKNLTNLRDLAEARDIILVELPSFKETGALLDSDKKRLIETICANLLCGD